MLAENIEPSTTRGLRRTNMYLHKKKVRNLVLMLRKLSADLHGEQTQLSAVK
jgi:hypothetical protein